MSLRVEYQLVMEGNPEAGKLCIDGIAHMVNLWCVFQDYWLKQSILDFLRKHDLATFTSSLSQCRAHNHSSGRA